MNLSIPMSSLFYFRCLFFIFFSDQSMFYHTPERDDILKIPKLSMEKSFAVTIQPGPK